VHNLLFQAVAIVIIKLNIKIFPILSASRHTVCPVDQRFLFPSEEVSDEVHYDFQPNDQLTLYGENLF
jgi:hypothetical protein